MNRTDAAPRTEATPGLGTPQRASRAVRWLRWLWWFIRKKPLGAFGALLILILLATAAFAPLLAPQHYSDQVLSEALMGPSRDHLLGTDWVGRDLLSRIIYGARVSIVVGFGAVAISTVLSTVLGVVTGYYGGLVDTLIQRVVDMWIAFPAIVLLISIIAVFGTGVSQVTIALGILLAAGSTRVVRSAVIAIKNNQYIESARALGAGDLRILTWYVVPNIMATIIVLATVQLGTAILAEATLSFLGYGVPPPQPSWGQMLSLSSLQFMRDVPGLAIFPGVAIALAVYGFNMLGDALRDV
ncbi:MAG TPA: ABC transporter permease, partial [Dehalococcoidia bacterium]|nr:ABC transporter permease [Dehalococcoidia bacterium]